MTFERGKLTMPKSYGLSGELGVPLLRCLAAGYGQAEIGKKLGLTHSVIRMHLFAIRQQLGARNTVHAVAIAIRKGIIK